MLTVSDRSPDVGRQAPGARRQALRAYLALAVGTGLGAGLFPKAPGTAGSLFPGLALGWALGEVPPWAGLAAAFLLFFAGWWAASSCERLLGTDDPPRVVIDEVVGMLISMAGREPRWQVLVGAFLLFRVADVWKPWPVRLIDRKVRGGLGIMADDVAAALYARAALEAVLRLAGVPA